MTTTSVSGDIPHDIAGMIIVKHSGFKVIRFLVSSVRSDFVVVFKLGNSTTVSTKAKEHTPQDCNCKKG